jgi:hypothetical protein
MASTSYSLPYRPQGIGRQRGMVTTVAMLFLIATVIFALAQMLNISSANVIDGQRQGDSSAALLLAESGLEKGHAIVNAAFGPTFSNTSCTGIPAAAGSPYNAGRGSITLSAVSTPAICDNSGGTACEKCTVLSTGQVGMTSRTVTQDLLLTTSNGVSCDATVSDCTNASAPPPIWKLNLYNTYPTPAIAVFSLASRRQGNNTGATCTNPNCKLEWNINSQNGANSVGSMGNAVSVASGGSYDIYQTLTASYSVAEVGALFPGSFPGPSLTGRYVSGVPVPGGSAYWNDAESGGTGGTIAKANSTSGFFTNDGTWTDPATNTCTTTPAPGTKQTCTSWCYGGDTLVFGFAGSSTSLADELSAVTFDTGGQNIAMTRIAKFPTNGTAGAPADVIAVVWYGRDPQNKTASDARSGALVTGYAGASFTGSISKNSTTLTVTSWSGAPLQVGDVINGGIDAGTRICAFLTGTGGNGTYTVSSTSSCTPAVNQGSNHNSQAMSVSSSVLTVTAATIPTLAVGDKIFGTGIAGGTTLVALGTGTGGTGTYSLSVPQAFASTTITSDGLTVTSASGTVVPTATTMIVSVKSGTGAVPAGTTIASSPAPTATTFKLSQRPTTPLVNATICGGTCAFFQHGATATTSFNVTKSVNTGYWGGGFMCLKGVDITPQVVTSSSGLSRRWTEVVH